MLLHSTVSDAIDDVLHAAVIALGFVLLRHPKILPPTVSLLVERFHAHVWHGAYFVI